MIFFTFLDVTTVLWVFKKNQQKETKKRYLKIVSGKSHPYTAKMPDFCGIPNISTQPPLKIQMRAYTCEYTQTKFEPTFGLVLMLKKRHSASSPSLRRK